ncbi:discoidin domain-containing protein [Chitinophaga niabensis]|uniref:discoidin domain-containing protein n=1 Tax=Chitinophaga niabensis TaxID=536979 RepID=UPI0031BA3AE2
MIFCCFFVLGSTFSYAQNRSQWVYPDKKGRLVYKTTAAGDRIMDFSYAGYKGGGVVLPNVPVKKKVAPSGSTDDTQLIQSAIDEVSALPLQQGFRGTVLLEPGIFTCAGSLNIHATGVVLRGSGSGKNGTTIKMTGPKHAAILIGVAGKQAAGSKSIPVTDTYLPAGTSSFKVADAVAFSKGDQILVKKPVTEEWIHQMEMDNLKRDGKPQTWISKNSFLVMERKITSISGNTITIDIPLADGGKGIVISHAGASTRITDAGVEQLHIQCPPLEIDYGHAPYSGIKINADDCWVKDVYCEETMNTTTLAGNRITMQQVVVTHTYTNLGASKPTDFSLEGSQNLIDRCEVTGGNTYFVWTAGLRAGPNVILNSTFRGHGSRIQPHMRWSTGLLVDNCTVADGGIDFMNRGVAGSGHGWTMGWGVAWNCIAKTYVIQNPPGAANWAIGCIGTRYQTARLFDSSPILPDGNFDSHDKPVFPQSLYLAQLSERLGNKALQNIGYKENGGFTNKQVAPLPPLKAETDPVYGINKALHRPINTSGGTRGENTLDGDPATYWTTDEGKTTGTLEIDMENPAELSAIAISEVLGNRVTAYKVEGQVNSDWKLLAEGTAIGKRKTAEFPKETIWKVRVTIISATDRPAISEVGLYLK